MKEKITPVQLAAMTLICDAFVLFCFSGSISVVTAVVFTVGVLLQLIVVLPFARFGGIHAKWAKFLCLAYVIIWGGMLFVMQWNTSEMIYIPYENSGGIWGKVLISGLIAAVCLYISSAGVKALARSAVIAAFIGAVCQLTVTASALINMDADNLTRAESERSVIREALSGLALSGSIGGFAVMLGLTKGSSVRNTTVYFLGKAVLTAAVTFTAVIVAGGIMKITRFPVVTAAQLSQPFSAQRIDSLFLIVFAIFAVFSIAMQTTAAVCLMKELFPKFRRYRGTAALLLMIAAAVAIRS